MASSSGKSTNQPTGACNGTAADFTNVEQELYDYQMHTKMCKKIAQLTKVRMSCGAIRSPICDVRIYKKDASLRLGCSVIILSHAPT